MTTAGNPAVRQAPWDPAVILVADNEEHDRLFAFALGADGLHSMRPLAMPDSDRPRDIEALARVGDAVLLVGSQLTIARRHARPLGEPPLNTIRSLHYFLPVLDEVRGLDPGYLNYVAHRADAGAASRRSGCHPR